MSRNGSGVYSLAAGNPVTTGTTISSSWANNTLTDIASALTASIASDGQTVITANLPMSTYAHTGVGVATARTMYGTAGQIQDNTLTYLTTIAGTNVITAVAPVLMSAYATGQTFYFLAAGGNTGAVTVNINAIGAKAVKKTDGSALISGDILTGAAVQIMYDGTNFQLLSDSNGTNETVGNLTVTGTTTATGLITANGGVSGALNGSLGATTPSTVVATDLTTTGNTILGNASTDTLNVGNGGLIKDAAGNVGVGVTPSAWSATFKPIDVGQAGNGISGNSGTTQITQGAYYNAGWKYSVSGSAVGRYESNVGVHSWHTAPSGTAGDAITFTQAMTLDASGNLLVGVSSFGVGVNSKYFQYYNVNGAAFVGHSTANAPGDDFLGFRYNAVSIGTITQSGTTAVLYNTTSDYRLKTDVTPIVDALSTITALNPVSFTWVDGRPDDGFLAHELQEVLPNCVTGKKDAINEDGTPKYQQMDNSGVVPFLVKAIQEQQALITSLTARLEVLEAK